MVELWINPSILVTPINFPQFKSQSKCINESVIGSYKTPPIVYMKEQFVILVAFKNLIWITSKKSIKTSKCNWDWFQMAPYRRLRSHGRVMKYQSSTNNITKAQEQANIWNFKRPLYYKETVSKIKHGSAKYRCP